MRAIIPEIMTEAMNAVAQHYVGKIIEQGLTLSQAELDKIMKANWESVSKEIAAVYSRSVDLLESDLQA